MNDDSKFLAIPKLGAFKIPFKLEEESLLDWLMSLNLLDAKSACTQIMTLQQTLNKIEMSAKLRLVFLKRINDYLKQQISRLENQWWDSGFPLSEVEVVYAQMVTWNYLLLAQGFFISAENSNKKEEIAFALAMTLHAIGQAQLHIAATYSTPNSGFWNFNYQAFYSAEKKGLLHLAVESTEFKAATINALFARNLVFYLCDSSQFQPRDNRTIFNFLLQVCTHLPFTIYPDAQQPETFMVDLKYDHPPIHVKNQVELGSELVRYFSTIPVANALFNMLRRGDVWHGTLKSINNSLFLRVVKTLELKQKRKYKRQQEENFSLLGVVGFENILGFLYSMSKMSQPSHYVISTPERFYEEPTQEVQNQTTRVLTLAQHEDELLLKKKNAELLRQKNMAVTDKIWDKSKAQLDAPNKNVSLKKINIHDTSTNGYAVSWAPPLASGKIGDLIGIVSADKRRLEIAIVRRIILTSEDVIRSAAMNAGVEHNQYFRLGTEVIGFESEIVYLSSVANQAKGVWAILIPGIELLKRPDTVIYAIGKFSVGENVNLHRGEKVKQGVLLAELHSTVAVSYVEMAYPKK